MLFLHYNILKTALCHIQVVLSMRINRNVQQNTDRAMSSGGDM